MSSTRNFWYQVNRVIEDSDVILEVLDARLVEETRNVEIEKQVTKQNKRLIYVINKCDLTPIEETKKKAKNLHPCVFVSAKDHLGTTILRDTIYRVAAKDKDSDIIVGVVGYPNTGKSSVINALKGKKSAPVSPNAGHTKALQKVRISPRIVLLDTPGVIPFVDRDINKRIMIGALSSHQIYDIELAGLTLIEQLKGKVEKHYGVQKNEDPEDTLSLIALKCRVLKRGGVGDTTAMARRIIDDWQRGKIK